jgi:hypothetical protein
MGNGVAAHVVSGILDGRDGLGERTSCYLQ